MSKKEELDELDRKILSILMQDAKMPYTDIAKKLFVSGGTIHVRMKKMEQMGVIKSATLMVDYSKLGYDVVAFLGVFLEKSSLYENVAAAMESIPEIVSAHYITGNYSIFIKIVCRDTDHLREILHDKIQAIDGIQRTETLISLEESINRPISLEDM